MLEALEELDDDSAVADFTKVVLAVVVVPAEVEELAASLVDSAAAADGSVDDAPKVTYPAVDPVKEAEAVT